MAAIVTTVWRPEEPRRKGQAGVAAFCWQHALWNGWVRIAQIARLLCGNVDPCHASCVAPFEVQPHKRLLVRGGDSCGR
eukprot:4287002-Amphidinium_carterae.1